MYQVALINRWLDGQSLTGGLGGGWHTEGFTTLRLLATNKSWDTTIASKQNVMNTASWATCWSNTHYWYIPTHSRNQAERWNCLPTWPTRNHDIWRTQHVREILYSSKEQMCQLIEMSYRSCRTRVMNHPLSARRYEASITPTHSIEDMN